MISSAAEHRERARKLRELAKLAPSKSEAARLSTRASLFDFFAQKAAHLAADPDPELDTREDHRK